MPTVLRESGFRLYFYADEGRERPHVHVQYGSVTAKFWLDPFVLARNHGMNANELRKAAMLVEKHKSTIEKRWQAFPRR
jgi:hypothetical protein